MKEAFRLLNKSIIRVETPDIQFDDEENGIGEPHEGVLWNDYADKIMSEVLNSVRYCDELFMNGMWNHVIAKPVLILYMTEVLY